MRTRAVIVVVALAASLLAADGPADPVEPAFGDLDAPIRPGSSLGGYCTFNWVFHQVVEPTTADPAPVPDVYIGTAAHCTDDLGERTELAGYGEIGTVVYDADLARSASDFSLIRIDADLVGDTNPQMRGFEGPTGYVVPEDLAVGDQVDVHGYGIVLGQNDVTRSRFGFLTGWDDREYVADMPAVNGDSGSPLLHDETGKALGIISRYGISEVPPSTDVGPLISWILDDLEAAGFDDVVLSTIS
ncbi:MAG: serine protease [Actinobacteria bacterium]|nr:serine protease [Actinomycetota bacterium]